MPASRLLPCCTPALVPVRRPARAPAHPPHCCCCCCCRPDQCNAKLFDSKHSLLLFVDQTLHPKYAGNKALMEARIKTYGFLANYVKAAGKLVRDNALSIQQETLMAYVSETSATARVAALTALREVVLLKGFTAAQLRVTEMFNQFKKDLRVGKMRQTLMVRLAGPMHHA